MKIVNRFSWLLAFAAVAFLMSCEKSSATDPNADLTVSATEDAAESMSSALGEDNGGVTDQIGDFVEISTASGLDALSKSSGYQTVDKSYDPGTGTWTLTLERERGNGGAVYAFIRRVYEYQFRNAQGQPQEFYVTNGDTANSISFTIVEGIGRHKNLRLSQELTGLSGSFLATNTHTDLVTVNGNYQRSAVDTLTTRQAVRTLDHSIALTLTDVTAPRGNRRNFSQAVSGTISGTYNAFATFTRGEGYRERTVERVFTIELGGGEATMEVAGNVYKANLQTGELID